MTPHPPPPGSPEAVSLPELPTGWNCSPVTRGNRSILTAMDENGDRVIEMYPGGTIYISTSDQEEWTESDLLAVLAHLRALADKGATDG